MLVAMTGASSQALAQRAESDYEGKECRLVLRIVHSRIVRLSTQIYQYSKVGRSLQVYQTI